VSVGLIVAGAALMVADLIVRSYRLRQLVRGFGEMVSLGHALALTAVGDTAATVTPWRIGGEIARVAGARRAGASYAGIAAALTTEGAVVYGLALIVGCALAAAAGADWWSVVSRHIALQSWSTAIAGVVLGAAIVVGLMAMLARRALTRSRSRWWTLLTQTARVFRQLPVRVVCSCAALSLFSLVARLAVLPLLTVALPDAPSLRLTTLGSFTLLYGQLLMPTPSGLGPVDVAFTYGAAGIDEGALGLLVRWRLLTTVMPAVIGVVVGVLFYGREVLGLLRRPTPGLELDR